MTYFDKSKYMKARYKKHKPKIKKYNTQYRLKFQEHFKKYNHEYYLKNKHTKLTKDKLYHASLRQGLIDILGGKCNKCGITDPRILQFDHICNNGNKRRKLIGGGNAEIRYCVANPKKAKKILQLLCANCHVLKTWRN